jgi:hypothetical protein
MFGNNREQKSIGIQVTVRNIKTPPRYFTISWRDKIEKSYGRERYLKNAHRVIQWKKNTEA